jgi:hypothetical protein
MNITSDVVTDLLPVYLAGEATADTNALIAEFLRENPGFSANVEKLKRQFSAQHELLGHEAAPSQDHQLKTLARTRWLMVRQKWTMAIAIMLTAFPLSCAGEGSHLTYLMVRDKPGLSAVLWAGAAIVWGYYFVTRRRLCDAGL